MLASRRALLTLAVLLGAGCGSPPPEGTPEPPCDGPPAGYLAQPPTQLSGWCMLRVEQGRLVAQGRAQHYELNTPLFSDYAVKYRTVWLPPGTQAAYRAEGPLDLPVGAVVTKTFAILADLRQPQAAPRLVETRVLMRTEAGWVGTPYLWNAEGTDAVMEVAGALVDVSWLDGAGEAQATHYLVPNQTQCKKCHQDDVTKQMKLLGPTAAQLNRDLDGENQLARWSRLGLLAGAPAPETAPRLARWDDPTEGLEPRARAYLDANCAHCHNRSGPARTSGLYLNVGEPLGQPTGLCKPPVAAGAGSGGLSYDVVPGQPEQSILHYRLGSTDPKVAMPELGRSVVHEEGVALVAEWIASLPGTCE